MRGCFYHRNKSVHTPCRFLTFPYLIYTILSIPISVSLQGLVERTCAQDHHISVISVTMTKDGEISFLLLPIAWFVSQFISRAREAPGHPKPQQNCDILEAHETDVLLWRPSSICVSHQVSYVQIILLPDKIMTMRDTIKVSAAFEQQDLS